MNKYSKNMNTKYDYRLLVFLLAFFCACLLLIYNLGKIQLIEGSEYKKAAYEQWASKEILKAERGIIYDSMGKKLAVSTNIRTATCIPTTIYSRSSDYAEEKFAEDEIKAVEDASGKNTSFSLLKSMRNLYNRFFNIKNDKIINSELISMDEYAQIISDSLNLDYQEVYDQITSGKSYVVLKTDISDEEEKKLTDEYIIGIKIIDDTKRVYPYGNFASYVLGFTNQDENGVYGVESTFNDYLEGIPGKEIVNTDLHNRKMPYEDETIIPASENYNVVLTINEILQHYAEDAAQTSLEETNAKRVNIIMMDPETGDVLAMASKPSYDSNYPKKAMTEEIAEEWKNYSSEELKNAWYNQWRNPCVNDQYEPGSTFKPLVIAMALEENTTKLESTYTCDGYAHIGSDTIKCWRYYNPHGVQTLAEILQNSCNDAMVSVGLELGAENMSKYVKALGFGEPSGIALNGEAIGIVPSYENMKDINTATMSFGQGISVTPIQLCTAISCIANDGVLMEPRVVKQLVDDDGTVVKNFEPVVRREVFSKSVANEVLEMMETVVSVHGGTAASIPGYRVAGKTGTAQKADSSGNYADDVYISSFVGVAPVGNPRVVCLMIVDEPVGEYYPTKLCAPVVGKLMEDTLDFYGIEPTEIDMTLSEEENIELPNFVGMTIKEASEILNELGLEHNVTLDVQEDMDIKAQFPKAGTMVSDKQIVTFVLK